MVFIPMVKIEKVTFNKALQNAPGHGIRFVSNRCWFGLGHGERTGRRVILRRSSWVKSMGFFSDLFVFWLVTFLLTFVVFVLLTFVVFAVDLFDLFWTQFFQVNPQHPTIGRKPRGAARRQRESHGVRENLGVLWLQQDLVPISTLEALPWNPHKERTKKVSWKFGFWLLQCKRVGSKEKWSNPYVWNMFETFFLTQQSIFGKMSAFWNWKPSTKSRPPARSFANGAPPAATTPARPGSLTVVIFFSGYPLHQGKKT